MSNDSEPPNPHTESTHTSNLNTPNESTSKINQENATNTQTSDSIQSKPLLLDKLKMSNKNTKTIPITQVKRSAPSSTTTSLSQKSLNLNSTSPNKEPKKKDKTTSKKPKMRSSTSSIESFYTKIDEFLEPSRELFKNIPESPLSFEQFKDFIENAQGGTDLDSLCIEYQSSPKAIIKIIETIRPGLTAKSIKNRLTRLSNALFE